MKSFVKAVIKLLLWGFSRCMLRNKRKIVFGAWCGKSYSDNAKYVFEHFFNKDGFRIVWIGDRTIQNSLPSLPRNASFARMGSMLACWHLITARYWVFTHSWSDVSRFPLYGGCTFLNVRHGTGGVKKFGVNRACATSRTSAHSFRGDDIDSVVVPHEEFLLVENHLLLDQLRKSYAGFENTSALPFGSATFDFLLANKDNVALKRELKSRIGREFGLPVDKKWIVYAPTFRWTSNENFSFAGLIGANRERLVEILDRDNAVIVEKRHPRCLFSNKTVGSNSKYIYSIQGEKALQFDQNYLWLLADLCISDYSAAIYLSYFSGNPVVHFVYDLDFYEHNDTGLSYPMEDIRVGPIARSTDELLDLLSAGIKWTNQVGKMVPVLFEYEKGQAGKQLEAFIEGRNAV